MRRFITLLIMLVVPLQFAWAAAAGLYGHVGQDVATVGFHTHGHEHAADDVDVHHDHGACADTDSDHGEDGHHCHTHPVFSSLPTECGLRVAEAVPDGPIVHRPAGFLSRIPPLLDRPPLARA